MRRLIIPSAARAAVLTGVNFVGGCRLFDPNRQGREARARIRPGLTRDKVAEAASAAQEYRHCTRRGTARERGIPQPGAIVGFDHGPIKRRAANGEVLDGFMLPCRFSGLMAFRVDFDHMGKAITVRGAPTLETLLNPP